MIFSNAHILQTVCGYLQFGDVCRLICTDRAIRETLRPLLEVRTTFTPYIYRYVYRADDVLVRIGPSHSRYVITIGGNVAKVNHSVGLQYTGDARVSWETGYLHMEVASGIAGVCYLKPSADEYTSEFMFYGGMHYIEIIDFVIHYMKNVYPQISRRGQIHMDIVYVESRDDHIMLRMKCPYGCRYKNETPA